MILFTVGYEGLVVEEFISLLSEYSIKNLVDIRELPQSRKSGFSKNLLSQSLVRAGISYSHDPLLGCPASIRHQYKKDNDWFSYSDKFLDYICGQREALIRLAEKISLDSTCIMCFEKDYLHCHRSYVSMIIKNEFLPDLEIINIVKTTSIVELPLVDRSTQLLTIDLETHVPFP